MEDKISLHVTVEGIHSLHSIPFTLSPTLFYSTIMYIFIHLQVTVQYLPCKRRKKSPTVRLYSTCVFSKTMNILKTSSIQIKWLLTTWSKVPRPFINCLSRDLHSSKRVRPQMLLFAQIFCWWLYFFFILTVYLHFFITDWKFIDKLCMWMLYVNNSSAKYWIFKYANSSLYWNPSIIFRVIHVRTKGTNQDIFSMSPFRKCFILLLVLIIITIESIFFYIHSEKGLYGTPSFRTLYLFIFFFNNLH